MDTQTNRLPLFLLLAGLLVVVLVLAYFIFRNNGQTVDTTPAGTPIPTTTTRPAAVETPTSSPSLLDQIGRAHV